MISPRSPFSTNPLSTNSFTARRYTRLDVPKRSASGSIRSKPPKLTRVSCWSSRSYAMLKLIECIKRCV
ncbi:Uncharacterised protein [Vibrio cholerae]|nr:Uncharacterised protein [Vibrio cholerae]CSB73430.1 Uncharacterised protein [Vibrio cholerae]